MQLCICGILFRPDCFDATSAIFCHLIFFFLSSCSFSFTTHLFISTGYISYAPNSTDFCIINSILLLLGSPWNIVTWILLSTFDCSYFKILHNTYSSFISDISHVVSVPCSSFSLIGIMHICNLSFSFILNTFFMWFTSPPCIFIVLLFTWNCVTKNFGIIFSFLFMMWLLYHCFFVFSSKIKKSESLLATYSKSSRALNSWAFKILILIIFSFNFEICFWMTTYWTNFWCWFSNYYMSAVSAFPNSISIFTKY